MAYVTVDVDVDLDQIEDDDLLNEVKYRNLSIGDYATSEQMNEIISAIWQKRREGKDYQKELDDLIYHGIGKIL
jgi:hypothetical protein